MSLDSNSKNHEELKKLKEDKARLEKILKNLDKPAEAVSEEAVSEEEPPSEGGRRTRRRKNKKRRKLIRKRKR